MVIIIIIKIIMEKLINKLSDLKILLINFLKKFKNSKIDSITQLFNVDKINWF